MNSIRLNPLAALGLAVAVLLASSFAEARSIVRKTSNAIVYETPWNELLYAEKVEALHEAMEYVSEKLQVVFPESNTAAHMIDLMKDHEHEVDAILEDANNWIENANDGTRGFRLQSLLPTGIIVTVGGSFTANLKIGGGGSMAMGFVFVPKKIERFHIQQNRVTTSYYQMDWAIIGLPSANLGVGIGGGAKLRVGAGFIWGELSDASSLTGAVAGLSGNLNLGFGNNIKALLVKRSVKSPWPENIMVIPAWEMGPSAEASIHGNVGPILPMGGLFRLLTGNFNKD